jgi:hypothetical protein
MRFGSLVLTLSLLLAAPAAASAEPAGIHSMADDYFRLAREAFTEKDYKHALELFRTSHGLEPGRGKLINIALCEDQVGQLVSALKHFREVAPEFPTEDERGSLARVHIAQLELRIPRLRIGLAAWAPVGTKVALDGDAIAPSALGTDIPVDAGEHVLTVSAPGLPERRYDVMLEEGKRAVLTLETFAGPAHVATGDDARRPIGPGIALGAAAVAGLGAGAVFVALRQREISDAEGRKSEILKAGKTCVAGKPTFDATLCAQQASSTARGDTFGTVSIVAFVAGGVATASALTYLLWPASKAAPASRALLGVAPIATASQQGVLLWGAF